MNFHIVSLFPNSFSSYIKESIIGRAVLDKKIKIKFYNPRDFVKKGDKRIDQKPYGGGPGMVIRAEPVIAIIDKIIKSVKRKKSAKIKIIFLTPAGKNFDTNFAKKIAKNYTDIIIICGRYEGIDERVNRVFKTEKITIGHYILTGGELPAMVILDCISRQIKGVLGNDLSREEERISSSKVFTRPEIFRYKDKNYKVPKVLLSGHHKKITLWKTQKKT